MADKDFVVKNGLVVNTNLIYANGTSNRVGINTATPDASLTVSGTANVTGNVNLTGANVDVTSYTTFFGNVHVQNTAVIDTQLFVGNTTNMVPLGGLPIIQAVDTRNGFVMISSQNLSTEDDSCADLLIYADNTGGLNHFNDLGINNSRFDGTIHRISANTNSDSFILGETLYQSNGTVNVAVGILRDRTTINATSRSLRISVLETDGIWTAVGSPAFSNTTGANLSIRGVTSGANADVLVAVQYGGVSSYSRRNYPFTIGKRGDGYLYNANSALTIGTTAGGLRVDIQTIPISFTNGANTIELTSGNTKNIYAELILAGTNIQTGTYITSVVNTTAFKISKPTTGSSSGSYTLTDPFYDAAGNPIIFHVNGMSSNDEIARISGNGNFTIGNNTISRSDKLTVAGTANITGNVALANNLTVVGNVTASGNVSSPVFKSGANVVVNTSTMFVGNSTANATQNSVVLQIANSTSTANLTSADLKIGTTVVNSSVVNVTLVTGNVSGAYANISGQVNTATLYAATSANIASAVQANATGLWTTGTVNAVNHTAGAGFGAATPGAVVNTTTIAVSSNTTVNAIHTAALLQVSNSTAVANLTATDLKIGISTVNTTAMSVGSNSYMNATASFVGNSTANVSMLSTVITVANSTGSANITPTDLKIGTTVANATTVRADTGTLTTLTVSGNASLNNISVTANASHNVISIPLANVNFDSGVLFVDSISNRVGINITTPDADLNVNGNANIAGNLWVQSNFTVGGTFTTTGTTEAQGNIVPISNGYSLGNTISRWNLIGITATLSNSVNVPVANLTSNLNIGANVTMNTSVLYIGNSSVYTLANSTRLETTGNLVVSGNTSVVNLYSSLVSVGANVVLDTGNLKVGNSTVNAVANSIALAFINATATAILNATAYSGTANNSTNFNGQAASYYANAENLTSGTIAAARLPQGTSTTIGALQVIDSVTNTSVSIAASANSVKTAADRAATAYTNAVSYVLAQPFANTLQVTSNAATAYTNAASYADTKAGDAYSNAVTFASNATNITSGTISYSVIPANIINTTASFTITGTRTYSANISTTANINFSNSTAVATIFANTSNVYFTGISYHANNATTVGGNTAAALRSYSDTMAATAYSNGVSYVTAQSYANTSQLTANAATAYTNAVSYVTAQSYANTAQVTANAATAYTNAITWSGNAALAYANAVTFASNATNITSGTLAYSVIPANIINTTATYTISGVRTHSANIVMTANVNFSNGTVLQSIYANTSNVYFNGIALTAWAANNATTVGGNTAATLRSYSDTMAATAYSNAVSAIAVSTANNSTYLGGILNTNYARTDTAETFNGIVTSTGYQLSFTAGAERHFMYVMTDRNVYFYGQDSGNKIVGLYDSNAAINRWYSNSAGALVVQNDITAFASDARLKIDVVPIANALSKVEQIRGVQYRHNAFAQSKGFEDKEFVGVIAQEVEKVLPQVVELAPFDTNPETNTSKSGENYKTVKYDKIVALLIEAIKELNGKVDSLTKDIAELKK